MPKKARVAITVLDLEISIAFYTRFLNFELVESQPGTGIAYIRDSDGDLLLVAGPHQTDPRSLLAQPCLVFKPGDTIDYVVDTFETLHARLVEEGLAETDMRIEENEHGERKLLVTDPNGYS